LGKVGCGRGGEPQPLQEGKLDVGVAVFGEGVALFPRGGRGTGVSDEGKGAPGN